MSIYNIGDMTECDHAEYRRIYDKHRDNLTVFSSYSGGILGMPGMSTAWGIKGMETALIASECENWEHRREDPEAWAYWKNADLVAALDREADHTAEVARLMYNYDQCKSRLDDITSEVERLKDALHAVKGDRDGFMSALEKISSERDAAVRERDAAVEALRFYADSENYKYPENGDLAVLQDDGSKARAALADMEQGS